MSIQVDPDVIRVRSKGMREGGWWLDRTVESYLETHLRERPEHPAVIGTRADGVPTRRISYGELAALVDRAAAGLRAMGVGRGDVVAIQLPNWWEFVVAALACIRLGAVANPLVHILRERELAFMLEFAGAKVFIVPATFRGFDHASMARDLQRRIASLERVVVVGEDSADGFERALLGGSEKLAMDNAHPAMGPDDLLILMYTSGTTGEPKGVMHTSNTINGNALLFAQRLELSQADVFFAATPVGHITGYAMFVLLPIMLGATVVLQDVHEPHRGVRLMDEEGATFSAGATPFLSDLVTCAISDGVRPKNLRRFYCAGAPIPPALIQRAFGELGLTVSSVWGMTEVIAGTMTEPNQPERAWTTDGRALDGIQVKIVDDAGQELARGQVGRLLVKGSSLFCGYLKRPEFYTVDDEGWFDSGDLARMDEDGYIRISGRTKELLIRGGENIPIIEVEYVLGQHPSIADVAIVGMPDPRLGERGCAFVVPKPGLLVDLPMLQAFLLEQKVAKPFWPERVECIDALPRTASGKVQRFALKERASRLATAA